MLVEHSPICKAVGPEDGSGSGGGIYILCIDAEEEYTGTFTDSTKTLPFKGIQLADVSFCYGGRLCNTISGKGYNIYIECTNSDNLVKAEEPDTTEDFLKVMWNNLVTEEYNTSITNF